MHIPVYATNRKVGGFHVLKEKQILALYKILSSIVNNSNITYHRCSLIEILLNNLQVFVNSSDNHAQRHNIIYIITVGFNIP